MHCTYYNRVNLIKFVAMDSVEYVYVCMYVVCSICIYVYVVCMCVYASVYTFIGLRNFAFGRRGK